MTFNGVTAIGILGSAGRMGQAIARAIADQPGLTLAGGIDKGENPAPLAAAAQVLIDFSSPHALEAHLDAAIAHARPLLIGTTGLEERHHWLIDQAAESIAVLQTGNTSLGVNMLAALVEQAAARLGEDWDIEIVETHHRMKVDAPSGTALLLGDAAARGRHVPLAEARTPAREGITGARTPGTIGFAALRGGTVAGDHTVHFLGTSERLSFSHLAENRDIFAAGALRGAAWLIGRAPGRYTMRDVLDI